MGDEEEISRLKSKIERLEKEVDNLLKANDSLEKNYHNAQEKVRELMSKNDDDF